MRIAAARSRRIATAGLALALLGGYLAAVATPDPAGAVVVVPTFGGTTPQVSRTTGNALRIYGSGFTGTTSVIVKCHPYPTATGPCVPASLGVAGQAAQFKVVDDNLLVVKVPAVAATDTNTSADIVVTNPAGSATGTRADNTGIYYTNATMTVSPSSGIAQNTAVPITVTVDNYQPSVASVAVQFSPLVGFLEGGPDWCPPYCGPPPYADPLAFPNFDAAGHLSTVVNLDPNFNTYGTLYDPNVKCAPTQETANYGLSQCLLGVGQFATGTLERHVSFTGNPVPAAPTLALSPLTAGPGRTVTLSGTFWNNNPYFGSDTTPNDPGETQLKVELCNSGGGACSLLTASATVDLTRYKSTSTTQPIVGTFSGTNLAGSFTVPTAPACAPNCLVKVSQEGYNYDAFNASGTGTFISATAALKVAQPPPADFTGDGKTDPSVFRPGSSTWFVQSGPAATWGTSGDIPVPGDYIGDTKTDFAVFRPSNGGWFVQGGPAVLFGASSDIPVPADYIGDAKADFAVFRPSSGAWFVLGGPAVLFGASGDIPVPGDYTGDGKADFAVFRPSSSAWFVQGQPAVLFGASGDIPVPGDYDGDAKTDVAVFRPSSGTWFVKNSSTGTVTGAAWGTNTDIPSPGDYDGDGKTDFAVYRPSAGAWFVLKSGGGTISTLWGTPGDVPLPLPQAIYRFFF